ncbi:MAG: thiamine-phosphate kinase [Candidatus Gastranaerophilales bacterium]|nr:thiamine-phosphate kinase [Candidatus Gastranaerophilales bacterium]
MNEQEILSVIKSVTGSSYIGDDCALLKDLGIVISQDSLVENVHFDMRYTTPYQLGYKSVMVNISDIAASGGKPEYLTASLSLPENISEQFIKEFYLGAKSALNGAEIVGGDVTGSDKIMISITALGTIKNRRISSRSNAKEGYVVITSGFHGSSAAGLKLLNENKTVNNELIKAHLMPESQVGFSSQISKNINADYAMTDSSDGLVDAVYKIAQASGKTIVIDFEKIAYDKALKVLFPEEYKDMVLYGGEDYRIIAAIPDDFAGMPDNCIKIGRVEKRDGDIPVKIIDSGRVIPVSNLDKCFQHFR